MSKPPIPINVALAPVKHLYRALQERDELLLSIARHVLSGRINVPLVRASIIEQVESVTGEKV